MKPFKNAISKKEVDVIIKQTDKILLEFNKIVTSDPEIEYTECVIMVIFVLYPKLAAELSNYTDTTKVEFTLANLLILITKPN